MHTRHRLSVVMFAALALGATVVSRSVSPTRIQAGDAQEETPLHQAMESLNRGQRGLRKLIADPVANKRELLESLADMERATLVALAQLPPDPESGAVLDADRDLWHVGYKQALAKLLQAVLSMESATLRADSGGLREAYDQLGQIKNFGHETYRDL